MTLSNCSWLTCGPCVVAGSKGSPTFVCFTLPITFSTKASWTFCSTNRREPAQQHWPWLKNRAKWAPAGGGVGGGGGKNDVGVLPPNPRPPPFGLGGAGALHD